MRFALLLYLDPTVATATTHTEAEAEMARYAEVTHDLAAADMLLGGEAFLPAHTATVVRVLEGSVVTDTPTPSDLELSGFYILDCDEEEAVSIAARMPVASHGVVEVRPLMDITEALEP